MSNGVSDRIKLASEPVTARRLHAIGIDCGYSKLLGCNIDGKSFILNGPHPPARDITRLGWYYIRSSHIVIHVRSASVTSNTVTLQAIIRRWSDDVEIERTTFNFTESGTETHYFFPVTVSDAVRTAQATYLSMEFVTPDGQTIDVRDISVYEVPFETQAESTDYTGLNVSGASATIRVKGSPPWGTPIIYNGMSEPHNVFKARDGLTHTLMNGLANMVPRGNLIARQEGGLETQAFNGNVMLTQEVDEWAADYIALVYEIKHTSGGLGNPSVTVKVTDDNFVTWRVAGTGGTEASASFVVHRLDIYAMTALTGGSGSSLSDVRGVQVSIGIDLNNDGEIRNLRVYGMMSTNVDHFMGTMT